MQFGVQHGCGDPSWVPEILEPAAVKRFAQAAERGGFGALAFTDHPAASIRWVEADGEGRADPFSSLGFTAAVTEKIRLLTYVLVLPYRNPFFTAHQVATLDRLSAGRATVGLGTGYLKGEFRALGLDLDERRALFDEHLEVVLDAWAGDVQHTTATFDAPGTRCEPKPIQQPHPPLWIHGNSAWGTERAARHGQGCIFMVAPAELVRTTRTAPIIDLDALARAIDRLRDRAEAAVRDPAEIEVVMGGHWPMLDIRRGHPTDEYIADVQRLAALGVDWIVVTCCGDDPVAAEESVARFGEDVIAAVNGR